MGRHGGRLVRTLAVVALVAGAGMLGGGPRLGGPGPAYAGTAPGMAGTAPCVAVVVDARLAGGSVQTGCARRDPDTGLEALTAAGFSYTPRPRDGLICQIDGAPQCSDTTTDRYWSYWYRPAGADRWVYASQGAGTHDPPPGSTEGWVWQDGGRREPPSTGFAQICPTRDREPSDPPASAKASGGPTGEPRDPPATGKPRPVSTKRGTATPQPTASVSSNDAATSSAVSASPSGSPTTAALAASNAARHQQSQPAGNDGGPAWIGLAVGAVVVAALAGAAWRRVRRTSGSGP